MILTFSLLHLHHVLWRGAPAVVFFFLKYKIGNSDFVTILITTNLNDMIPATNYCSKPTDDAHRSSLAHTESPHALNVTPVLLVTSVDLILGSKHRFITILDLCWDGFGLWIMIMMSKLVESWSSRKGNRFLWWLMGFMDVCHVNWSLRLSCVD